MNVPDLEKQRRFALSAGLLVITYFAAAVEPEAPTTFEVFGAKFTLARPELLPLALVLAALYGALRFLYYGCLIERAPWQVRRQMLAGMRGHPDGHTFEYGVSDSASAMSFFKELSAVFPFADRSGPGVSYRDELHPDTGQSFGRLTFRLTRSIRVMAWLQDLDYTAPIWVNVLAVGIAAIRWPEW
jgi:hypothetical protein